MNWNTTTAHHKRHQIIETRYFGSSDGCLLSLWFHSRLPATCESRMKEYIFNWIQTCLLFCGSLRVCSPITMMMLMIVVPAIQVLGFAVDTSSLFVGGPRLCTQPRPSRLFSSTTKDDSSRSIPPAYNDEDEDAPIVPAELLAVDKYENDDEELWISDRERARRRSARLIYAESVVEDAATTETVPTPSTTTTPTTDDANKDDTPTRSSSPYTEEEQQLIADSSREPGYLGDCTLGEITQDYGVPFCWLADVLCNRWKVPHIPLHPDDRLGDLVTGEQAFALVEALHTFDGAVLYEQYADATLQRLCEEWEIPLAEAVEMAMQEGWGLPMGVHTFLRVEQEKELVRVLGDWNRMVREDIIDEEED